MGWSRVPPASSAAARAAAAATDAAPLLLAVASGPGGSAAAVGCPAAAAAVCARASLSVATDWTGFVPSGISCGATDAAAVGALALFTSAVVAPAALLVDSTLADGAVSASAPVGCAFSLSSSALLDGVRTNEMARRVLVPPPVLGSEAFRLLDPIRKKEVARRALLPLLVAGVELSAGADRLSETFDGVRPKEPIRRANGSNSIDTELVFRLPTIASEAP